MFLSSIFLFTLLFVNSVQSTDKLCNAQKLCVGEPITCQGAGCKIICSEWDSCREATITCEDCEVECTHLTACRLAVITSTTGIRKITCSATYKWACWGLTINLNNGADLTNPMICQSGGQACWDAVVNVGSGEKFYSLGVCECHGLCSLLYVVSGLLSSLSSPRNVDTPWVWPCGLVERRRCPVRVGTLNARRRTSSAQTTRNNILVPLHTKHTQKTQGQYSVFNAMQTQLARVRQYTV